MKILFISRWYPYPPDNGSKIRIFNLIKYLSFRHEVDLISFATEAIAETHLTAMHRYCRRVTVIPYRSFQPTRLKALLGFFSPRPRSVIDTYNVEMQLCVDQANQKRSFDLVVASQVDMAPYVIAFPNTIKILEELEVTTLYEQFVKQPHPLKKLRGGLTWWKLSHYVGQLLSVFDGCTVVSEGERERVRRITSGYPALAVVPNGVDLVHYTADFGPPETDTLIYSGALTYQANFDAVDYFLREILPLIQLERPQVKLIITGKLDGVPVDRLPKTPGVIFTGYLDDIRPAVAQSWASIVPLRVGGGTRLKILEALALGTPVVTTSKGVEGLDLVPGCDLLLADSPADFATAVLRLLADKALREQLSCNGRRAVESKYDWQMIGQQFNDFIEQAVAPTQRHLQPLL